MSKAILIVEDEPGVVVAIQFLMEQQGYSVLMAEKGEDALDLIYQYKPDLILLDIMLPGMSGWEVCENIRLNPDFRNIKIVFITARGDESEVARGLALGANAYIIKPFSNDHLIAKVRRLLENAVEETGK
ncbi:MAG: response regulator [Desulfobacterales bacterium]|nr:response regulator [Desulfobacterales bacterium]